MMCGHPPAGRTAVHGEGLVKRWLKSVQPSHAQVHTSKSPDRGNDNFGSERQRGDYNPWCDRTVVGAERGATRDVVEKFPFDAVDHAFDPTRPVARRESPAVFSIAHEFHWIANRVFLLYKG